MQRWWNNKCIKPQPTLQIFFSSRDIFHQIWVYLSWAWVVYWVMGDNLWWYDLVSWRHMPPVSSCWNAVTLSGWPLTRQHSSSFMRIPHENYSYDMLIVFGWMKFKERSGLLNAPECLPEALISLFTGPQPWLWQCDTEHGIAISLMSNVTNIAIFNKILSCQSLMYIKRKSNAIK